MPDTPPPASPPPSPAPRARAKPAPGTPPSAALVAPTPEAWYADPRAAFDAWMSLQRFRSSSILVYRAQWHHFLDWLAARGRTLRGAEPALIDEFAATIDVKRQQRARYLRIMERVFDDMSGQSQALGNPARAVTRSIDAPWTDTASNAPTGFLDRSERTCLWEELARADAPDGQPLPWRDLRDRAMAAMLLGAGLKLNELESMRLDQVRLGVIPSTRHSDTSTEPPATPRWSIQQETDRRGGALWIARAEGGNRPPAPYDVDALDRAEAANTTETADRASASVQADWGGGDETVPTAERAAPALDERDGYRTVPIPLHAAVILQRWLQARAENAVEADLVFPAGRNGLKMHKATALRAIDVLVERSGLRALHHGRVSPQTLRNAYAAALFSAGLPDEQVAERLGMIKVLSARRLRAAWDVARAAPNTNGAGDGSMTARPSRRRDRT
ncbi:tyrosine-type recombinase/integrase [Robbsia sp. KACC 23696]|uniref:tyrosine-type recombinase/integrase n=1 Tax=Robbsia sp. KACC 23696 TaxID=3149231 RepID=UPI00325A8A1D